MIIFFDLIICILNPKPYFNLTIYDLHFQIVYP